MHLYVIANPAKTIIVSVISKYNVPRLKSSSTEVRQYVAIKLKFSEGVWSFDIIWKKKKTMCHGHTTHVLIPELGSWICDFVNLLDAQIYGFSGCTFYPLQAPNAHFSPLQGRTLLARIILHTFDQTNCIYPNQAFTSSKYYSTAVQ